MRVATQSCATNRGPRQPARPDSPYRPRHARARLRHTSFGAPRALGFLSRDVRPCCAGLAPAVVLRKPGLPLPCLRSCDARVGFLSRASGSAAGARLPLLVPKPRRVLPWVVPIVSRYERVMLRSAIQFGEHCSASAQRMPPMAKSQSPSSRRKTAVRSVLLAASQQVCETPGKGSGRAGL